MRVIHTVPKLEVDDAVLHSRCTFVGWGAMRVLFDAVKFKDRVESMQCKAMSLNRALVLRLLQSHPAKIVEETTKHMATLYVTYKLKRDGDVQRVERMSATAQSVQVDNKEVSVVFVSCNAKLLMIQHAVKAVFDDIVSNTDTTKASFYGASIEVLVLARLLMEGTFRTRCLEPKEVQRRQLFWKKGMRTLYHHDKSC